MHIPAPINSNALPPSSGQAQAIIIVKAAPQLGEKHGETVCTAAITHSGEWVRLYPIAFRTLDEAQKFSRWDVVNYDWRKPNDDKRLESCRVSHETLQIIGKVPESQRFGLIHPMIKTNLKDERSAGRSLAFVKPLNCNFTITSKSLAEYAAECARFEMAAKQVDMFRPPSHAYRPAPYKFKYTYELEDGRHEGTCQDWETEASFFGWTNKYGEQRALEMIQHRWGVELPAKGILFAMGTHSLYPDTWLINGIIQLDEIGQLSLGI